MNYIYIIMGKSAVGKDSIYKEILSVSPLNLNPIILYTTRPKRNNEVDGREYHFVTLNELEVKRREEQVVEERCFDTVFGRWYYFTSNDKINLSKGSYITINTLSGFNQIKNYFGEEKVIPIYIEIPSFERLLRAVKRETKQKNPNAEEVCRRFLADNEDFSEENLLNSGVTKKFRFINDDLKSCIEKIVDFIKLKENCDGYKGQSVDT